MSLRFLDWFLLEKPNLKLSEAQLFSCEFREFLIGTRVFLAVTRCGFPQALRHTPDSHGAYPHPQ